MAAFGAQFVKAWVGASLRGVLTEWREAVLEGRRAALALREERRQAAMSQRMSRGGEGVVLLRAARSSVLTSFLMCYLGVFLLLHGARAAVLTFFFVTRQPWQAISGAGY